MPAQRSVSLGWSPSGRAARGNHRGPDVTCGSERELQHLRKISSPSEATLPKVKMTDEIDLSPSRYWTTLPEAGTLQASVRRILFEALSSDATRRHRCDGTWGDRQRVALAVRRARARSRHLSSIRGQLRRSRRRCSARVIEARGTGPIAIQDH